MCVQRDETLHVRRAEATFVAIDQGSEQAIVYVKMFACEFVSTRFLKSGTRLVATTRP